MKRDSKQPAKAKAAKPAKGAAAMTALLAPFEFPHRPGKGLCFDAEGDRAFERGYPHLRILSDAKVSTKDAEKIVVTALDAIDPELRVTVPRVIARLFLLGYRIGPLLFVDANHPKVTPQLRDERLALMRSDRAIDLALLEESLEREHAWGMGETYARWRWPKVLYLYEAFLGNTPVLRTIVAYLVRAAADVKRWGFAGQDPKRQNTVHHHIAAAVPWLLLRAEPAVAAEARAALRAVPPSTTVPTYVALLHWIAAGPGTPAPIEGFETLDGTGLVERLAVSKFDLFWHVGRVCWLLGTERLAGDLKIAGFDLPRMVDSVALVRDPGVVRLMTLISAQRAGKKPAGDWLHEHSSYARPIVEALTKSPDAKHAAAAKGALELIGQDAIEEAAVMSDEELEATIARIFMKLGKELLATKDRAAHVKSIRAAYEAYTEARAAAGDPIPEAYFTHRFGDFGLGEFGMLAADSI